MRVLSQWDLISSLIFLPLLLAKTGFFGAFSAPDCGLAEDLSASLVGIACFWAALWVGLMLEGWRFFWRFCWARSKWVLAAGIFCEHASWTKQPKNPLPAPPPPHPLFDQTLNWWVVMSRTVEASGQHSHTHAVLLEENHCLDNWEVDELRLSIDGRSHKWSPADQCMVHYDHRCEVACLKNQHRSVRVLDPEHLWTSFCPDSNAVFLQQLLAGTGENAEKGCNLLAWSFLLSSRLTECSGASANLRAEVAGDPMSSGPNPTSQNITIHRWLFCISISPSRQY